MTEGNGLIGCHVAFASLVRYEYSWCRLGVTPGINTTFSTVLVPSQDLFDVIVSAMLPSIQSSDLRMKFPSSCCVLPSGECYVNNYRTI